MRPFKIAPKLGDRTYLSYIFNMDDHLMNIQFKKGPALYDPSLPIADDWFHIGMSSVKSRNSISSLIKGQGN